MKKEKQPYSKKKAIVITTIGICTFALSFVSIFIGIILEENNYSSNIYVPFFIIFLVLNFLDIIFLIYHYNGLVLREVQKKLDKTMEVGCVQYRNVDTKPEQFLADNKFKLIDEGYFHKKKFSFTKDYINIYIKKIKTDDLENTIKQQFEKFDNFNFKTKNKCLILIIEKEEVNDDDLKTITNISSVFTSMEVIPMAYCDLSLIALFDSVKKDLYLVPPVNKLSFYSLGYKFCKKMFNIK